MAKIPSEKELSDLLGGAESEAGPGLDLGYYLHLLIRYLWIFLAIILLAVGAAAFFALQKPKLFVSTGVLQVEAQEQKVLPSDDIQTVRPEAIDYITTIVATLTSDSLLVRVAKAAGLLDDPTFFTPKPDGTAIYRHRNCRPHEGGRIGGRPQAYPPHRRFSNRYCS